MAQKARNLIPTNFLTELVSEDPDTSQVHNVKLLLSEKEGIPSRQRRLSFSNKHRTATTSFESLADQIRNEAQAWQAIVFANDKAVGRFVHPSLETTSKALFQTFEFTFKQFLPVEKPTTETPTVSQILVDSNFKKTEYRFQLFGRLENSTFPLPCSYQLSGEKVAASLSLHQQKAQYIQRHKEARGDLSSAEDQDLFNRDISVTCGSGSESCIAVFGVGSSPATLKSLKLSLVVCQASPSQQSGKQKDQKMEAVLSNTTEPKSKDFPLCKDTQALSKLNGSRNSKKPKKKKNKPARGSAGGNSGHDRCSSDAPFTYGYNTVASNRSQISRGQQQQDLSSEQTESCNCAVVDEILKSIDKSRMKGIDSIEADGSEKQSVESPPPPDDLEISNDGSTPKSSGSCGTVRGGSFIVTSSSPKLDSDLTLRDYQTIQKETEARRKQLVIDMNDFDEDEIYIRKNRSNVSLNGGGPEGLPSSGSRMDCMFTTESQLALGAIAAAQQQFQQNKQPEKQGWRLPTEPIQMSPTLSPQRLNFRSANGLLLSRAEGKNSSSPEDHSSSQNSSNSQTRISGNRSGVGENENLNQDLEHGLKVHQLNLQSLFQQTSQHHHPHHQITHISQQLPNFSNLHLSGIPTHHPLQNTLNLASQQLCQSHLGVLGNVSNLTHNSGGGDIGAPGILLQDAIQTNTPESMRNGTEEFMKHKEDNFDDYGCFYHRSTNDLDRFLSQATPMIQLDSNLEPQEAMDQLVLEDIWKFYYESSMLGREIPLQGKNANADQHAGSSSAYYLPYLSGMQIFTAEESNSNPDTSNLYQCDLEGWPQFMRLHYEQFEVNPPWFRLPMYDMMDKLSQSLPELLTFKLMDLHPASWFCVAWYPLYRIPDAPLDTRFLTFHSFHPPLHQTRAAQRGGSVPLPVYGLEYYNMRDDLWLDNIRLSKGNRSPSPSKLNDDHRILSEGKVENVEQQHWLNRIRYLRNTGKSFARGLSFRRCTRHGPMGVNTHHHDFEYFYERN